MQANNKYNFTHLSNKWKI